MGLDRIIRFPDSTAPCWDAIQSQLARVGVDTTLRMIDGLPVFPDETPPEGWQELRLGTAAGMVTLRRGTDFLVCVVWGNADDALLATLDKFAWACAATNSGKVETQTGTVSADEYADRVGISPA